MTTFLYCYGIMLIISAIIFAISVKNAEYHPDENLEEDSEFIKQVEEIEDN